MRNTPVRDERIPAGKGGSPRLGCQPRLRHGGGATSAEGASRAGETRLWRRRSRVPRLCVGGRIFGARTGALTRTLGRPQSTNRNEGLLGADRRLRHKRAAARAASEGLGRPPGEPGGARRCARCMRALGELDPRWIRGLGYAAREPRCVAHGQQRRHRKNGAAKRELRCLDGLEDVGVSLRKRLAERDRQSGAQPRAMDHALRNRAGRRRGGWRRTAPPLQIRCAAGGNAGGCQTDRCGLAGDGGRQRMERLRPAGSGRCGHAPKKNLDTPLTRGAAVLHTKWESLGGGPSRPPRARPARAGRQPTTMRRRIMNRYPRNPLWLLCALAALALGLAACGGDEPAAVAAPPAPPPAPPPFQPQPVEVALGDNGGSATLMTTEAGGFTLNGEAFTGGADAPVEGEGGRMYVLTLADGSWSAAFLPMEITVPLGASEESATLMTTEAGGFTLGGQDFASGGSAMTEAGASYTLTMGEDGSWSAAFAPMEVPVTLGASGDTATLWTTEAGGFTLDGEAFESGGTAMSSGGGSYTLTRGEDGAWSAAFAPMEVPVTLGASGDTATLRTTEAGGFTLGGEAFESGGTAVSSNGGSYTLTRGEDGMWAAAFVPVTRTVTLGTSGSSVDLVTDEAGGYTVGGEAFASGGRYTVGGLTYTLTLGEDGAWMAAFVPVTRTVTLGASGSAVTLSSTEAGGWAIGSSAVESGATQQADNGNRYTLTLAADGEWSAAFLPMKVSARLGGSGEVADLWTTEAMGVTLNGQAVESGATTTTNSQGETYVLSLADGAWSGAHRPRSSSVDLGASEESVTLATNEAGRWTLDGAAVSSGRTTVQSAADNAATEAKNEYVLTLAADGSWSAAYRPLTMPVEGTGLTASANEDGSGYTLGTGDDAPSLDASGAGTVTVDGAMFRVIKDSDDMLQGTRFDNDIEGSVMKVDTIGTTAAPGLLADNAKTDLNEKNTALEFHTADFSMGDLLGAGVATAEGDNIVAKARADMVKIRDRVAGLVALKQDGGLDGPALTTQLLRQWTAADGVIRDVFGGDGEGRLERTTSESRVLDAFDRLVDALSSESAFAAATLANGPDKLQGFDNRNAAQAAQAFGRVKWLSTARLGALGSTRFGAAVWNETGNAKAGHADPERAQAFAWSTMLQTRRSNDVRVSGSANYQGRTHAADDDGNLYAGTVDINVRFTRGSVDGRVDGLERADTGNPFVHGLGGAVRGIVLPTADLNPRASWSVTTRATSSSLGRLQYTPQAGGQPDLDLSVGSTFAGRLLGRGDQAGDEAIGTWKAVVGSTTLAGGFGATRGADSDPPGAAVTGDLASIGKTGAVFASLERRPGPALPEVVATDNTARPTVPLSKVINTNNATFTYNAPVMYDAAGAEYVNGNYTPARATVLEDQDWEGVKGNWVSDARARDRQEAGPAAALDRPRRCRRQRRRHQVRQRPAPAPVRRDPGRDPEGLRPRPRGRRRDAPGHRDLHGRADARGDGADDRHQVDCPHGLPGQRVRRGPGRRRAGRDRGRDRGARQRRRLRHRAGRRRHLRRDPDRLRAPLPGRYGRLPERGRHLRPGPRQAADRRRRHRLHAPRGLAPPSLAARRRCPLDPELHGNGSRPRARLLRLQPARPRPPRTPTRATGCTRPAARAKPSRRPTPARPSRRRATCSTAATSRPGSSGAPPRWATARSRSRSATSRRPSPATPCKSACGFP